MDQTDLDIIKTNTSDTKDVAQRILEGNRDNYDGCDGAREVVDLCSTIERLVTELEKHLAK
jgi:hypothetical protein